MSSVIERLFKQANATKLLKSGFENLKDGTFDVTSKWDAKYNCIAHAAEENKRKWWPIAQEHASKDRYWPEKAPRRETVRAFVLAFQTLGYEKCESAEYEEGYEKVAIYISEVGTPELPKGAPTHMARQLPCGNWTSKLGDEWDIRHDTLDRVAGRRYGIVKQILCRKRAFKIVGISDGQPKNDAEKTGGEPN